MSNGDEEQDLAVSERGYLFIFLLKPPQTSHSHHVRLPPLGGFAGTAASCGCGSIPGGSSLSSTPQQPSLVRSARRFPLTVTEQKADTQDPSLLSSFTGGASPTPSEGCLCTRAPLATAYIPIMSILHGISSIVIFISSRVDRALH